MKKIPTIFIRNPENRKALLNEPHPFCEWVFAGDGIATRKYDGACCCIIEGELFKRREVKKGKEPPLRFVKEDFDEVTGKMVGWVPVSFSNKEDQYFVEGFSRLENPTDGTFELVGPKVQGNPELFLDHCLMKHSEMTKYPDCPTGYEELKGWLQLKNIEGVVWHHPDGRMAKIKKRDFGFRR